MELNDFYNYFDNLGVNSNMANNAFSSIGNRINNSMNAYYNNGYSNVDVNRASELSNRYAPIMNTLTTAFAREYVPSNAWRGYGVVGTTSGGTALTDIGSSVGGAIKGPYGNIISGLTGMAGNMVDMYSYNPEVTPIEDSMYNQNELPVYNLSEERNTTREFVDNAMSSANKKLWSNVGKGASTGAVAGSLASPIGTAIGAVGGALVGLGTGLLGKSHVKKQAERAMNEMKEEYSGGIRRLNAATENYYDKYAAQNRYNAIRKQQGGLFNLPSYSPYFGL